MNHNFNSIYSLSFFLSQVRPTSGVPFSSSSTPSGCLWFFQDWSGSLRREKVSLHQCWYNLALVSSGNNGGWKLRLGAVDIQNQYFPVVCLCILYRQSLLLVALLPSVTYMWAIYNFPLASHSLIETVFMGSQHPSRSHFWEKPF